MSKRNYLEEYEKYLAHAGKEAIRHGLFEYTVTKASDKRMHNLNITSDKDLHEMHDYAIAFVKKNVEEKTKFGLCFIAASGEVTICQDDQCWLYGLGLFQAICKYERKIYDMWRKEREPFYNKDGQLNHIAWENYLKVRPKKGIKRWPDEDGPAYSY